MKKSIFALLTGTAAVLACGVLANLSHSTTPVVAEGETTIFAGANFRDDFGKENNNWSYCYAADFAWGNPVTFKPTALTRDGGSYRHNETVLYDNYFQTNGNEDRLVIGYTFQEDVTDVRIHSNFFTKTEKISETEDNRPNWSVRIFNFAEDGTNQGEKSMFFLNVFDWQHYDTLSFKKGETAYFLFNKENDGWAQANFNIVLRDSKDYKHVDYHEEFNTNGGGNWSYNYTTSFLWEPIRFEVAPLEKVQGDENTLAHGDKTALNNNWFKADNLDEKLAIGYQFPVSAQKVNFHTIYCSDIDLLANRASLSVRIFIFRNGTNLGEKAFYELNPDSWQVDREIEVEKGDIAYVVFNFEKGWSNTKFNIEIDYRQLDENNDAALEFITGWKNVRHDESICYLLTDTTARSALVNKYSSLSAAAKTIVDSTKDLGDYTIGDTMAYLSSLDSLSLSNLGVFGAKNTNTTITLVVAASCLTALVGIIYLAKRRKAGK